MVLSKAFDIMKHDLLIVKIKFYIFLKLTLMFWNFLVEAAADGWWRFFLKVTYINYSREFKLISFGVWQKLMVLELPGFMWPPLLLLWYQTFCYSQFWSYYVNGNDLCCSPKYRFSKREILIYFTIWTRWFFKNGILCWILENADACAVEEMKKTLSSTVIIKRLQIVWGRFVWNSP